jgi:hypothetical protein
MWLIWIIGILVIFFILYNLGKKEKKVVKPTPEPEPEPCVELKKLSVIYNGRFLTSGEVVKIPYNVKVAFTAKGFDITGTKEACLEGKDLLWDKSCPCTYWDSVNGLTNSVRTNNKTKNVARNVWVKCNGISFNWKVMVI